VLLTFTRPMLSVGRKAAHSIWFAVETRWLGDQLLDTYVVFEPQLDAVLKA
jgi:hypothetical protein